VWRTTDGGITWDPVFAHKPVSAIGALAIAASNKKIVWVGTGEANPRNDDMTGDGVWLSTDGGATFKHRGLDGTAMISRILVDPKNPNIVLAAALGNAYIDDENRGVYRTTDAGKTWKELAALRLFGLLPLASALAIVGFGVFFTVRGFTQIGYYRLLPATEIRAYREPTNCTGPYFSWPLSELRKFDEKSGLLVLSLDTAP